MPKFYMLTGVPGSGKSTWASRMKQENPNIVVLSSDDIVTYLGSIVGMSYNEIFNEGLYSVSEQACKKLAETAFRHNLDVIWDQTNLTLKTRSVKLRMVPKHYEKISIFFSTPDDLDERLAQRRELTGKHIPDSVVSIMKESLVAPTMNEGFDQTKIYLDDSRLL